MQPSIEQIRSRVESAMVRRGVLRAAVFGSFPRGTATESSDLDFLVEFEAGRSLVDLAGLRLDPCDVLGREVYVATPGSLHPSMRDRIVSESVRIL